MLDNPLYLAYLVVLLPLFASIFGAGIGYKLGDKAAQLTTSISVTIAAIASWVLFSCIALGEKHGVVEGTLMPWIQTYGLDISFGVMVDKLTATMFIVVTTVSACVHWYSWEYMHEDKSRTRFFAYLSLFTFMMLALVSAPNMLQMFLGWEGVGLASYLLIGFWHHKESANVASVKAFITNRVADVALLLALFTTFIVFKTFDYKEIFALSPQVLDHGFILLGLEINAIALITLFLFIGAMGKSAQLGFHVWLPDAMEGPTPVSALIHAATMVTAGVFLVCRMSPLFEHAESVLTMVAWVGALTAIFAATIGLTQRDIKRVIAYSTCSQLGYMFFACGVSAYGAAMFHLTTHAFFKALLFLGAGAVIHAMHHEQDMFKMGALKKALPVTYVLMWIGSLALAGIPPFAGFFSKDLILESAVMSHSVTGNWLYIIGTAGALLTAIYSVRVLMLTFHGEAANAEKLSHAHEPNWFMKAPMLLLGVGAVVGGFLFHNMAEVEWWHGAIMVLEELHIGPAEAHHTPAMLKFLPLVVILLVSLPTFYIFAKKKGWIATLAAELNSMGLYNLSFNKWYVDEIYDWLIVRRVKKLANVLWQSVDIKLIDSTGVNGVVKLAKLKAEKVSKFQDGYIFNYVFVFIATVTTILTIYFIMLGGK